MVDYMPTKNASEIIETLTRKLERSRIRNDLNECQTLEDFEEVRKKYNRLCQEDAEN